MPLIRAIKALLVACIGAFGVLVAYDNVVDYGSNWAFVQHVLSMDTVFPDNALRASRAITDPGIQRIAYWAIIATEAVFGLLCLAGAWRLYRARHDSRAFVAAKPLAVAGARTHVRALLRRFHARRRRMAVDVAIDRLERPGRGRALPHLRDARADRAAPA